MAKKVMHRLKNHLWYLVEEMVPLSLFSSTVSEFVKDRIVKKMLSYPETDVVLKRNGTGYGKPTNPPMPDSINEDLSRFIGPGSIKFVEIAQLNNSVLSEPVVSWELNLHYHEARKTILNLAVTNDAAERGVKLCADFIDSARKEDTLQTVLRTVENEKARLPKIRPRI